MNFAQFLEMRARGDAGRLGLVDARVRLDVGELDALANRTANLLRDAGLKRGDRVALYLGNRAEVALVLLGAMKAGIVAVPINRRLAGPELERVLAHCAPGALVTSNDAAAAVAGAAPTLLAVDDTPRDGSFWTAVAASSPRFASVACQAGDVANLLYTSGTTATPKAAIHTHGMRVAIASAMADCFRLSARDVGLAISPLFHTSGLSVFGNCIFAGCPLVLQDKWDLDAFLATIEAERVTFMHLIGTLVVDIARADAARFRRDTRSVRFVWGGGHSLDPAALATFEARIGTFVQGYSRTEGGLTYNPIDRDTRRFDANGFPNRNSSDVAVVDPETQRPCAVGSTGEIVVRGDGVSPGYWDGEFVRTRPSYDGGWQPTGDLGFFDDTGSLHFLGRADGMIKTGGENVFPVEIEAALLALPDVADAVVVGLPDARLGHRVAAVVVPRRAGVTAADVERGCRAALAGFKIPRRIVFADALPRLGTQKVDLAACRRLLSEGVAPPAPIVIEESR